VMIVRRHCEALSETSRFFTERGVRPHFAYRSVNDERVMQMVAAGVGITLMPECYQASDVARPKLAGFDLQRTIGLVYAATAEAMAATPPAMVTAARAVLGGGDTR
jgi:DNA-binding transcriptional LysR family regulator